MRVLRQIWHADCFRPIEGRKGEKRTGLGSGMDTFSPEFSGYWQSERELVGERHGGESASSRQILSPSQQVALEELADRVNAARSVV